MFKAIKLMIFVVFTLACIFSLLALSATQAFPFTWEGELDPNEFDKWKVVSAKPSPQGFAWVFIKNPDQASLIKIVAMAVDLNSTLIGYRYFKGGTPYSYVFDSNEEKYVRQHFTDEQRRSCMKCHSDKPVPQVSI